MIPLTTPQLIVVLVFIAMGLYYTYATTAYGKLQDWIDKDLPAPVPEVKTKWLLGFTYNRHGEAKFALLDPPVCLDHLTGSKVGRFVVAGSFAGDSSHEEQAGRYGKDLVSYDFAINLTRAECGDIGMSEEYRRISITNIHPLIEDSACEKTSN